jgi:hypothetical protein
MVAISLLLVRTVYWTRVSKILLSAENSINFGFAEIADMKIIWNRKAAGVAKRLESKIKACKINKLRRSRPRKISVQVAIAQIKTYYNLVVFAMIVF